MIFIHSFIFTYFNNVNDLFRKEQNNFLEVDHSLGVSVDFMNLTLTGQARKNDDDFVDDLSVPPLE